MWQAAPVRGQRGAEEVCLGCREHPAADGFGRVDVSDDEDGFGSPLSVLRASSLPKQRKETGDCP